MNNPQKEILKSAIVALNQNNSMSYGELAKAIGISRATLYRHFASREDLIKAIILFSLEELDHAVSPLLDQNLSSEKLLFEIIRAMIPMGERFNFLSQTVWDAWGDDSVKQVYTRQTEQLMQLIDLMQQEGKLKTEMPRVWIGTVFNNLIYSAWESVEAGDIARNDAADLVYRTFMNGFGA